MEVESHHMWSFASDFFHKNMMFLKVIHAAVVCPFYCRVVSHGMDIPHFLIQSHLGCFDFLVILSNTVMNSDWYTSLPLDICFHVKSGISR